MLKKIAKKFKKEKAELAHPIDHRRLVQLGGSLEQLHLLLGFLGALDTAQQIDQVAQVVAVGVVRQVADEQREPFEDLVARRLAVDLEQCELDLAPFATRLAWRSNSA